MKNCSRALWWGIIFILSYLYFPVVTVTAATPERISAIRKNLKSVEKIYLHAGLTSVIEFPKAISEVRIGNPQSLKVFLSNISPNEMTIYLNRQTVEPTNIIVKSEKRFYVFDIIPSKTSHQDYVKVSGAFGSSAMADNMKPSMAVTLAPKGKK